MTSPIPKIASLLFILVTLQVSAQQDTLAIKYATTISIADLKDNLTIIASDALEGRETGKRGQKMAAAFIASAFQELGLSGPVNGNYYQPLSLYKTGAPIVSLQKDGAALSNEEYEYIGKNDTQGMVTVPIVFVGYADERDANKADVNGKAVVLLTDENTSLPNGAGVKTLESRGAKIIFLVINSEDNFFQRINMARGLSNDRLSIEQPELSNKPGHFLVSAKAAEKILGISFAKIKKAAKEKKAEKIKASSISYSVEQKSVQINSENVLGYLEGTDKKEEVLVITAHYDHIGISKNAQAQDRINNGADDDGSGTVAVLSLAKAFANAKKEGHGPRRSILFMTVTGEEKGLLGSLHYTNNPVFPLEKTIVDLNIDMIGRSDRQHKDSAAYVYIIGSDKLSTDLHTLSEATNNTYTKLIFDYTYNDMNHPEQLYYRSDHWNFAKNNIPIIFYFDGIHEDYHMPSDEVDKIEFDLLMQRTKTIFHTAWEIANREHRLVLDK